MTLAPNLTIVVAMSINNLIGCDGDIPWRGKIPADMDHFVDYTTEKIVVMGRKTYDSIPKKYRPLSKRENIILSRKPGLDYPGCAVVHDPSAIERISASREVCILGGGEVYKIFLPVATRLIVTHVEIVIAGDTFFPPINPVDWTERLILHQPVEGRNKHEFSIKEYTRIT